MFRKKVEGDPGGAGDILVPGSGRPTVLCPFVLFSSRYVNITTSKYTKEEEGSSEGMSCIVSRELNDRMEEKNKQGEGEEKINSMWLQ